MKRLICAGCGYSEDLDEPTGEIRTMQVSDLSDRYGVPGGLEKTVTEDLCKKCRDRLRRDFFGILDGELMGMPLMPGP